MPGCSAQKSRALCLSPCSVAKIKSMAVMWKTAHFQNACWANCVGKMRTDPTQPQIKQSTEHNQPGTRVRVEQTALRQLCFHFKAMVCPCKTSLHKKYLQTNILLSLPCWESTASYFLLWCAALTCCPPGLSMAPSCCCSWPHQLGAAETSLSHSGQRSKVCVRMQNKKPSSY